MNITWYRLLAISAPSDFTPIYVRFFRFLFCFNFLNFFLEKKINIAVVGNVPGNVFLFYFFPSITPLAVYLSKSEIFRVPNFGQKHQKTLFFTLTHFPFLSILKSSQKTTYVYTRIFRAFVLINIGSAKSRNYDLVIFGQFLNFGPFFGPFCGTVVKNTKKIKVAPGHFLYS